MLITVRKTPLILLGTLAMLILILTLPYSMVMHTGEVTKISSVKISVNGETSEARLPLVLKDLPHETEVTVSFSLPTEIGTTLFFGAVYSPLIIEANGETIYEYGVSNTFPPFFIDPPTQYDSVALPTKDLIEIQMHYRSPRERTRLSIHAPLAGVESSILHYLLARYGLTMIIALFFILLGIFLIGISLFILQQNGQYSQKLSLIHPGMLFLFSGAWQFGESPLAVYLSQCPSLLYIIDFLGIFLLMIPLYKMGIYYLDLKSNRLLNAVLLLLEISAGATILLQMTGLIAFHRSLYYFHILLPLAMLILTSVTLYEYLRFRNRRAGLFSVSFMILAFSAILEVINYYVYFIKQYSVLFQIGLFIFVIGMSIFTAIYAQELYDTRIRSIALENELKIQEQTIAAQRTRNELLLDHFEDIRKQRHDLRHHLRTINEMIQQGKLENVSSYIQTVTDSVPAYKPEFFCKNSTLNATLSYYAQQIKNNTISLEIHVQIPEDNPHISDANLCVIFGNLLENALESCQRIKNSRRYIKLSSQVRGEMLFITMDNSCDGNVRSDGTHFYSSKRPGPGTGLSSIRSIAETHNGSATFREMENMFRSEVSVRL